MDETFDLDKLRQAWGRATEFVGDIRAASLDGVKPLRDPHREAMTHLAELERTVLQRFPHAELALRAFLIQLRQGLGELGPSNAGPAAPSDPSDPSLNRPPVNAAPAATIEELRTTLDNLEELLEVFAMTPQLNDMAASRR